MANNHLIKEVTYATIAEVATDVNDPAEFGTFTGALKETRSDVYKPMVVRVTDHPADDYVAGTPGEGKDTPEHMALFISQRHGEPWVMKGAPKDHLLNVNASTGAVETPAAGVPYSHIYVKFDYTEFE